MKVFLLAIMCGSMLSTTNAFSQSWTTKASVPGNTNDFDNPAYFSANNKIYVGGGIYSTALKEYDPVGNTWTAKANIPGTTYSRVGSISFSANGKGYIGLGADFNSSNFQYTRMKDLQEYDPVANTYASKATFPGTGRSQSTWFVINDKLIMVGGADSLGALDEVWEYNITSNTWTQKQNFPAGKLTGGCGFTINGKGYIALGNLKVGSSPAAATKKVFEYDATNDTWIPKADYPGAARFSATAFVLNNKAYVGMGASIATQVSYTHYNDFYPYDPTTGWGTLISSFPGNGRQHLASAVVNGKGYVGTGWTYINGSNTYYRDWYEFSTTTSVESNGNNKTKLNIYPNPASDILMVDLGSSLTPVHYTIYNMAGQKIANDVLKNNKIDINNIPNGQYIINIISDKQNNRQTLTILHN